MTPIKEEEKSENALQDGITETVSGNDGTTDMSSAMDKVALDLYAILQGTQKLSGEDSEVLS